MNGTSENRAQNLHTTVEARVSTKTTRYHVRIFYTRVESREQKYFNHTNRTSKLQLALRKFSIHNIWYIIQVTLCTTTIYNKSQIQQNHQKSNLSIQIQNVDQGQTFIKYQQKFQLRTTIPQNNPNLILTTFLDQFSHFGTDGLDGIIFRDLKLQKTPKINLSILSL